MTIDFHIKWSIHPITALISYAIASFLIIHGGFPHLFKHGFLDLKLPNFIYFSRLFQHFGLHIHFTVLLTHLHLVHESESRWLIGGAILIFLKSRVIVGSS